MNARIRSVVLVVVSCWFVPAIAQQKAPQPDDLDVTMQIIVDPDAKLPDEVVRRIPLPASRSAAPANATSREKSEKADKADKADAAKPADSAKGPERVRESAELGREAADSARERAQDAQQQREEARAAAEDRGKGKDKDKDRDRGPPGPPDRPEPHGPPRP